MSAGMNNGSGSRLLIVPETVLRGVRNLITDPGLAAAIDELFTSELQDVMLDQAIERWNAEYGRAYARGARGAFEHADYEQAHQEAVREAFEAALTGAPRATITQEPVSLPVGREDFLAGDQVDGAEVF